MFLEMFEFVRGKKNLHLSTYYVMKKTSLKKDESRSVKVVASCFKISSREMLYDFFVDDVIVFLIVENLMTKYL